MTIIGDASSLILLAKVDLLETFASRNKIIIPELVYKEVIKGKDRGRSDGFLVERLVSEKKLLVKLSKKAAKSRIESMYGLRGGELEVIALALDENHDVLTDDKRCMNVAKALNIYFITSLDVIISMRKKGVIGREKALECLADMEEYGWYSKKSSRAIWR